MNNLTADQAETLKNLVYKRGQVKGKLTRFKSFFETITEANALQLKLRLKRLEEALEEFESIQSEIELLDKEESQVDERSIFETLYFDLLAQGQQYLDEHTNCSVSNAPGNLNQSISISSAPQVRLPPISLPTFTGLYEEWMPFADAFKSLIQDNDTLSDIQRFHYLKSSIKGEAAHVISALETTSTNYSVAWSLLESRYKNIKFIVQRHVKALFELPSVEKESAATLRQLLDSTLSHMRSLKALDQPTEHWDTLVVHLVATKLTYYTYRDWENTTKPDELPKLQELIDFLQKRCLVLENTSKAKPSIKASSHSMQSHNVKRTLVTTQNKVVATPTNITICRFCKGTHNIISCKKLISASHEQQVEGIKAAGLCFNCLRPGHTISQCQSGSCKKCSGRHNTLLHPKDTRPRVNDQRNEAVSSCHTASSLKSQQVLLSTAVVDIVGRNGKAVKCRALLDNGSQSCLMTESLAQQLQLSRHRHELSITGIDQCNIKINGLVEAKIRSCVSNFYTELSFLVVQKITGPLPTSIVNMQCFKVPDHVALADPGFNVPGRVDILIGQEIFWELLCIGQIKTQGYPTLQKTRLGWVVGGRMDKDANASNEMLSCHLVTNDQLSSQLQQFWKIDEHTVNKHFTAEESTCEEHYLAHTTREVDGRYTVKMPLHSDPKELGNSREGAKRRFLNMEKRLMRDPVLHEQYKSFMTEYETLNHMEECEETKTTDTEYILPHHPILKASSTTTKLRVVFDASAKTTSGKSLNDLQLIGPTIQSDLFSIVLRFRIFNFVLTADLEKMYRQVNIHTSQRDLLKIIWRDHPSQPLRTYRLKTVTYGTASAAYLATRTLHQLADDEVKDFPNAAAVTKRDFYVDDLMTGTSSIDEGIELQRQLIGLLSRGGFNIRKWNSNSDQLLEQLDSSQCERQSQELPKVEDSVVKTLGMWWDARNDNLCFKHSPIEERNPDHLTKRILLSEIARLFDPLGLLAPIVIRAKVQIQELWKLQLGWDEALPMHLHTEWKHFLNCLTKLSDFAIARQVTLSLSEGTGQCELVGFSDASEKAYGAAVYLLHRDIDGNTKSSLICAKSRVTPLKTISIPRLELCGALLLTELVAQVKLALNVTISETTYLTDSTVVLAWIKAEPACWNTFVANRVAKIQTLTADSEWLHVKTDENPADLISRGSKAELLAKSNLWWKGPAWLAKERADWPNTVPIPKDLPEERSRNISIFVLSKDSNDTVELLLKRKSSFQKICRIIALCIRFIKNLKAKSANAPLETEPLSQTDVVQARDHILKFVQKQSFPQELKDLTTDINSKTLPASGRFVALAPFIGKDGLLRVGGRLSNSSLNYDSQHQILLPKNHIVTEMIAREEHIRQLHCGPQALLYAIRQQYWPINGRCLAKRTTHNCVKCSRARPRQMQQQMGNLPHQRTNPARAFLNTGVDYCGPFFVRPSKRRGLKPLKAYVAVFVCLVTKAVHLELVGDLTTEAFLGALRRFTARRGISAEIHSDNGTTFVGAKRQLQELYEFLEKEAPAISQAALQDGIKWRFIPPYSPHMGGLWEAAVKSLKHHLRRISGSASLTFEDFNTVLAQVEAVLNSRPLTPMSNDPSDLTALTPAHFLTGGSLTALPDPLLLHIPEGRLSRWQRMQRLLQHFWSRWSKEYLNNLQQRGKWKLQHSSPQVGSLVLLKDDNLPPLSWTMGRIIQLHPGKDSLVRVVTVKTAAGEVKRCISKVCPLPIE